VCTAAAAREAERKTTPTLEQRFSNPEEVGIPIAAATGVGWMAGGRRRGAGRRVSAPPDPADLADLANRAEQ